MHIYRMNKSCLKVASTCNCFQINANVYILDMCYHILHNCQVHCLRCNQLLCHIDLRCHLPGNCIVRGDIFDGWKIVIRWRFGQSWDVFSFTVITEKRTHLRIFSLLLSLSKNIRTLLDCIFFFNLFPPFVQFFEFMQVNLHCGVRVQSCVWILKGFKHAGTTVTEPCQGHFAFHWLLSHMFWDSKIAICHRSKKLPRSKLQDGALKIRAPHSRKFLRWTTNN